MVLSKPRLNGDIQLWPSSKQFKLCLAALSFFPPLAIPLSALAENIAVLIGSNFDLSTGTTTQRLSPYVAYNSVDNEYTVVWFDTRNPGNNDVFGQQVSASGELLGANIPIIEFAGAQVDPVVAYNSTDNEYLVAWRTQQPGFFNDVRGRRLSSIGTLLGGDFFILGDDPLVPAGGGFEPSMAYNPTANEHLVTGRSLDADRGGVRGRRVSNSGALLGGAEIVISTGGAAPNGQVAYNPNTNEYLATWRDQVVTERGLKGRHISANGVLVGDEIVISSLFPGSGNPTASVAFDPTNDRYLVVFGVFQETEILGQFVSSSGALMGENFSIASNLTSGAVPFVAYSDIDSVYLVVWLESNDIVGQLLSVDGNIIGERFAITSHTALRSPRLALNSETGEFLVVWADGRNINQGERDIFAQIVGIRSLGDLDGDGIPDQEDECPNSDLNPTVVISGVDTHVPNVLFEDGCTISDDIAFCAARARNHGQFIRCVTLFAKELTRSRIITGRQKGATIRAAAQAEIP